jgi:hypothetical protein
MISSEYDSIQIFTSGRVFEISDNYVIGGKHFIDSLCLDRW